MELIWNLILGIWSFVKMRILVAYATAGSGHRRAAEALADAARQRMPEASVACVDVLAYCPRWLRWWYPRVYEWLVRATPTLWAVGYYTVDHPWIFRALQLVRRRWNLLVTARFLRWVQAFQPDVVLTTHFLPTDVLAAARRDGRLAAPLTVVITDLFPHRLWLAREADHFVVGSAWSKQLCEARGIPGERIDVFGIPVGARFTRGEDRLQTLQQVGLDPSRRTLLLASGGMGVGPMAPVARRLVSLEAQRPGQLQVIVVCGDNQKLATQLTQEMADAAMPARILGFVETMPELMRACELLITKPGGLTMTEASALGVPMVLYGAIPGQEQFNAAYAVEHGAAIATRSVEEMLATVLELLDHPERLHAMRQRALAMGRPHAASEIIESVLTRRQDAAS